MELRTLSVRRLATTIAAAGVLGALSGCYTEGGPGFSLDQYTYVSTSWRPLTITLKDTRTGQDFWSIDLPVEKKLVIKFMPKEGTTDKYTPDLMKWGILEASEDDGRLGNSLPVPSANDRRLDVTLRPAPELPEGMSQSRRVPAAKSTGGPTPKAAEQGW